MRRVEWRWRGGTNSFIGGSGGHDEGFVGMWPEGYEDNSSVDGDVEIGRVFLRW